MAIPAPVALTLIFVGGGGGACRRSLLSRAVATWYRGAFPLATAAINLSGSVLLGLASGLPLLHGGGGAGLLLAGTGLLGGYATYSTAALEATLLLREGSALLAAAAWAGAALMGLLGAGVGMALAAQLWPGGG